MKQGFVIWFTGLPASGKSTLARMLKNSVERMGLSAVVLDGDRVRRELWPELKYSPEDRNENIRRMSHLAAMLANEGVVAIVAVISPYRRLRKYARDLIQRFVEVYLDCPVEVCEKRDPKGMYAAARRGEIAQFTGVSDPYEPPENPELVLKTGQWSASACLNILLERLRQLGYIGADQNGLVPPNGGKLIQQVLTPEEANRILESQPVKLKLGTEELMDAEKIAVGAYSPLSGFMNSGQIREVLETYRLPDGTPFGMPIYLCVEEKDAQALSPSGEALLCQGEDHPVAFLNIEGIERVEPLEWAMPMYGTDDLEHPGVARLARLPRFLVSGKVSLIAGVQHPYSDYEATPETLRYEFTRRGWRKVAAFQTRNPPHRAHEYTQRFALEITDGLLIHPILGTKKEGDFSTEDTLGAYELLIRNYYPVDRVILKGLSTWMRYAGPREAVFHAVVRRNYGCSHFIVGRDHAGVGSYYAPYAAQELLERLEVGVEIIRMRSIHHCRKCGQFVSEETCPHSSTERTAISMTQIRQYLKENSSETYEILRPEVAEFLRSRIFG